MNKDYKYIFLFFFNLAVALPAIAQVTISGIVKSDADGTAISFATVALFRPSSTIFRGTTSNGNGEFILSGVDKGNYYLEITMLGYEPFGIQLLADKNITIGEIYLKPKTFEMEEVVVVANIAAVKQEIDRTVVNVQSYMLTNGKTAADVLKVLPGVISNGNDLSVLGKGAKIYLDGRPLQLSEAEQGRYLETLSGDRIDKVELITNPSSRFDAGYSGAIVNIKLKRDTSLGLNGLASMTWGIKNTGFVYTPSINLNFRSKKLNVYGDYGMNYGHYQQSINYLRKYHHLDPPVEYDEYGIYKPSGISHSASAGVDYFVSSKHTLGLLATVNTYDGKNENNITTQICNLGSLTVDSMIVSPFTMDINSKSLSVNLNHNWDLGDGVGKINTDVTYSYFDHSKDQTMLFNYSDIDNNILRPMEGKGHSVLQKTDIWTVRIDHENKFLKDGKIEIGCKFDGTNRNNDLHSRVLEDKNWIENVAQSNDFRYDEQIYATYFNLSKTIDKFSLMGGLRAEYTYQKGNQITMNSLFTHNYYGLFPSLYVKYAMKNNQSLLFSYSRKINRPSFSMLNPFRFYTSPGVSEMGNPNLKPYYIHSFEVRYVQKLFTLMINHNRREGYFLLEASQNEETKEINYVYMNFGNLNTSTVAVNIPIKLLKRWGANINGALYYNDYKSLFMGENFSNDFFSGNITISNRFSIYKGLTADLQGIYRSATWSAAMRIKARGYLQASVVQSLWNGKGNVSLTVIDPFRWDTFESTFRYGNIDMQSISIPDMRMLRLNFIYNFGSDKIKKNRNRKTGAEDLQNRAF